MSSLSSIVELSESNTNEQNSDVLNIVANYTAELATFVDNSNIIINDTVSFDALRRLQQSCMIIIMIVGCTKYGRSCELSSSVESGKHYTSR